MPDVVLADANVLYGNDQRNLFMTFSVERVISLRWTDDVLHSRSLFGDRAKSGLRRRGIELKFDPSATGMSRGPGW